MSAPGVDENLKSNATEILSTMGLAVSDFMRIGMTKVVHERGFPFEMRVPDNLTEMTL